MNAKKIIKYALLDIGIYGIFMGIFLIIFYLVPYELDSNKTDVSGDGTTVSFSLPSQSDETEEETTEDTDTVSASVENTSNSKTGIIGKSKSSGGNNTGNTGTTTILSSSSEVSDFMNSEKTSTLLKEYEDDTKYLTITKNVVGTGSDTVTYYVMDLYVTTADVLKTALAQNTYGNNIKDTMSDIMEDNDALIGMTGDSYGNNDSGIVIRNGILYREEANDTDVCILFSDGTMKTYSPEEFDLAEVTSEGVYQGFSFGPMLLDENGDIPDSYNTTSYLGKTHPRAAIGYVEPGHYVLVVVDGRNEGYSRGVTLSELSYIMQSEGCVQAYNLDGGNSTGLIFDGEYINQPLEDRKITDILYLTADN